MIRVKQLLRQATTDVVPSISLSISRGDAPPTTWHAGHHGPEASSEQTGPRTFYDLASLTKPLTTLQWCLELVTKGLLRLEDPIGNYLSVDDQLAPVPIWRLLNHTTGLPAHRRYYQGLGSSTQRSGTHDRAHRAIWRMLDHETLESAPGQHERYSDVGFLTLERVCTAASGVPLKSAWPKLVGHGPDQLHFRPIGSTLDPTRCATTERCPWRKRHVQGEVHDDNCWVMRGIGGHAGLFGTLDQVHGLAQEFLALYAGRKSKLRIDPALFRNTLQARWMHPHGTRVLGWDTPTPGGSTAGRFFSRRSIGHLGFTGTSVWIDLEAEVVVTLLTNRVSPSRDSVGIRRFRPTSHDAARRFLDRQS